MTEPLYYLDPMTRRCKAVVTRVESEEDGRFAVELDRTVMYPEGGGQPGDRGLITSGPQRWLVVDTVKRDEAHLHLCQPASDSGGAAIPAGRSASAAPEVGAAVEVTLDWDHRWDYMQQHTGQHILSAALLTELAAPTVAVAQGAEVTTIEVDRAEVSLADLERLCERAAEIIAGDHAIRSFEVPESELNRYPLRRPTSRRGVIRLVEIADTDLVACGGVHLPRTALAEAALPIGTERLRGRTRISFAIGRRAVRHAFRAHHDLLAIAQRFSTSLFEAAARVEALERDALDVRGQLRRRTADLARAAAEPFLNGTVRSRILDGEDLELFDALAQEIAGKVPAPVVLLAPESDRMRWAICVPTGSPVTAAALAQRLLAVHNARGGGKPPLFRGVAPLDSDAAVDAFLSDAIRELDAAGQDPPKR